MPNSFVNLALTQLGQVTLLVVLAGLLHRLLADRTPRLMLMVWTLVALKAITPPIFSSDWGLFSWAQAQAFAVGSGGNSLPHVEWTPSSGNFGRLAMVAVTVWMIGSAAMAVIAFVRWHRLNRLLNQDRLAKESPLFRYTVGLAQRYDLRAPASIVVSREELGPAVAGVVRPTVILPASFVADRDPATLRPVLLHELVHLQRNDTAIAVLHTAVRIVWWFNPLVWWAARQAEVLVERCVDLTVTRDLQTSLHEYGRGLLRVLELRATLQPSTELASLRPCQITTERLNFLREACRAIPHPLPAGSAVRWARRAAFALLAATLLPALPTDALLPGCESSVSRYVCPLAVAADAAREAAPADAT